MDDADDLRKQLEEEVKKSEAIKNKLANEQLAQVAGLQVQALKLSPEQEEYAAALLAKITNAPLTAAEMSRVALSLNVEMSEEQASKVFTSFDMDKDGVLNPHEFALWWLQCYRPASVLLRAAMTNKYEKLNSAPAKPEWTPGIRINYNFTTGTVDDSFKVKSAIYLSALPSSKELFEKSLRSHVADVKTDDGEEFNIDKAQGVTVALAPIDEAATEEDINECVELFKAVAEEYSAVEDSPVSASAAVVTENGKKYLKLVSVARQAGDVEAIEKFAAFARSGQAKKQLFEKLLVGLEFGTDATEIFNATSTKPIAALLDNARGTVIARGTDNIADLVEAMTLHGLKDKNLSRSYIFERLIPPSILSRGIRSITGTTAFDSPRHLLESALEELVQTPLRRAVERNAPRDELLLMKDECEQLRTRVRAVIQRYCPWEITCRELLGFKKLDKFLGAPQEQVRIAIIGPQDSGKTWLTHCLQFPEAASLRGSDVPPKEANAAPATGAALVVNDKPVVLFDIRADALNVVPGMRCHAFIVVVDGSETDPVGEVKKFAKQCEQLGIREDQIFIVLTHMDKANTDRTSDVQEALSRPVAGSKLCCTSPEVPLDLIKGIVDSTEIETGAADTGDEVAQTLALAFRKVARGIEHIFVHNELADAHLSLQNLPLFGFFPGTKESLSAARGQARAQLRGTRQSMKSMSSANFDACKRSISMQVEEKAIEEGSSSEEDN